MSIELEQLAQALIRKIKRLEGELSEIKSHCPRHNNKTNCEYVDKLIVELNQLKREINRIGSRLQQYEEVTEKFYIIHERESDKT